MNIEKKIIIYNKILYILIFIFLFGIIFTLYKKNILFTILAILGLVTCFYIKKKTIDMLDLLKNENIN